MCSWTVGSHSNDPTMDIVDFSYDVITRCITQELVCKALDENFDTGYFGRSLGPVIYFLEKGFTIEKHYIEKAIDVANFELSDKRLKKWNVQVERRQRLEEELEMLENELGIFGSNIKGE